MKNLIKYGIIVAFAFLFTGCMSLKFPVNNNVQYLKNNVETRYSKIDKKSIIIIKKETGIITQEKKLQGGTVKQIVTVDTKIADNASKVFMEQYFSNVKFGNESEKSFIQFSMKLKDFNFELNKGYTPSFDLKLNVIVKKEGNLILEKMYNESTVTPALLNQVKLWKMSHKASQKEFISESLHLGLLTILETKVKPDLLKALAENN